MSKPIYTVLVGNIGKVYTGTSLKQAKADFEEYKSQSIGGYGRASGEQVSLFKDDEPFLEHFPDQEPEPEWEPDPLLEAMRERISDRFKRANE